MVVCYGLGMPCSALLSPESSVRAVTCLFSLAVGTGLTGALAMIPDPFPTPHCTPESSPALVSLLSLFPSMSVWGRSPTKLSWLRGGFSVRTVHAAGRSSWPVAPWKGRSSSSGSAGAAHWQCSAGRSTCCLLWCVRNYSILKTLAGMLTVSPLQLSL